MAYRLVIFCVNTFPPYTNTKDKKQAKQRERESNFKKVLKKGCWQLTKAEPNNCLLHWPVTHDLPREKGIARNKKKVKGGLPK